MSLLFYFRTLFLYMYFKKYLILVVCFLELYFDKCLWLLQVPADEEDKSNKKSDKTEEKTDETKKEKTEKGKEEEKSENKTDNATNKLNGTDSLNKTEADLKVRNDRDKSKTRLAEERERHQLALSIKKTLK